jgi:threonine dehydrogenase-like Zn-dependent dehydrogenase
VTGASPEDVRPAIDDASSGLGADLVIDAAGVEPSWTAALELARPGGTVAEIGLGQATGAVAVGDIVRRGLTLRGVYAYTDADFRAALGLLRDSPPPLDWAETRSLADGPGVLDELGRGEGPVKAIFALQPGS